MKVEIPQILWNCEDASNKGLPTALMSLSLLPISPIASSSASSRSSHSKNIFCLATAGNCTDINLWTIEFPPLPGLVVGDVAGESGGGCMTGTSDISSSTNDKEGGIRSSTSPSLVTAPTGNNASSAASSPTSMIPKKLSTSTTAISNNNNSDGSNSSSNKTKIDFICSLTRHEGPVNIVAFSPNGQHLISASDTGSIIVWSVPIATTTATATTAIAGDPCLLRNYHRRHAYSYYWTNRTIQKEADLSVKIISSTSRADSIIDLSWSSDSKRFVVGTIDHTILIYEDIHYNTNHQQHPHVSPVSSQQHQQLPSEFKVIYRNSSHHTHYIQGVAFDPLQVYVASQSSDRTIRIWQRKENGSTSSGDNKNKKNSTTPSVGGHNSATNNNNSNNLGNTPIYNNALVTIPTNTIHTSSPSSSQQQQQQPSERRNSSNSSNSTPTHLSGRNGNSTPLVDVPIQQHQQKQRQQLLLTKNKFELQMKTKQMKYRSAATASSTSTGNSATIAPVNDVEMTNTSNNSDCCINDIDAVVLTTTVQQQKQYLFAAETTLESFVRRLSWTVDGVYLIVPAAMWSFGDVSTATTATATKFATLIYQRHKYDEPYKILCGHDKPSIAVCPNPVLFQLPMPIVPPTEQHQVVEEMVSKMNNAADETKENYHGTEAGRTNATSTSTAPSSVTPSLMSPTYRNIFAVLTWDSVLIYDTVHDEPLAIARGLHYANIVDASWTDDGHALMVCSTDGYISILRFTPGELGDVYHQQPSDSTLSHSVDMSSSSSSTGGISSPGIAVPQPVELQTTISLIPPCEPGSATIQVPPRKKTRITPTLVVVDSTSKNGDGKVIPNGDVKKSHKRTASEAAMAGAVHKLSLVETTAIVSNVPVPTTIGEELNVVEVDDENHPSNPKIPLVLQSNQQQQNNDDDDQHRKQFLTPPPLMKKQKKRIQPIQLISQPGQMLN